jgi:hypothetical protein
MDDETAERTVEKAEYVQACPEILVQEQSITKEAYLTDHKTQDVVPAIKTSTVALGVRSPETGHPTN